jgi:hypothetical protein
VIYNRIFPSSCSLHLVCYLSPSSYWDEYFVVVAGVYSVLVQQLENSLLVWDYLLEHVYNDPKNNQSTMVIYDVILNSLRENIFLKTLYK